jgi:hypothetical protein
MFGFVEADKGDLKVREFNLYKAYYCGLCKSISSRYSMPASVTLSYDGVFLAILLAALSDDEEDIREEHCMFHHIKKRPVVRNNDAVDYAADMLIVLAYHKVLDDKEDEHLIRGTAGELLLRRFYNRVSATYRLTCQRAREALSDLDELERKKSPSIDLTGAAFGRMLGSIFSGYLKEHPTGKNLVGDPRTVRILERTGFDLGRWIYLADAAFDLAKDEENGSYNPLIYRKEGAENIVPVMASYIDDINADLDLLDIYKNNSIIENISVRGLWSKTEEIRKLYEMKDR